LGSNLIDKLKSMLPINKVDEAFVYLLNVVMGMLALEQMHRFVHHDYNTNFCWDAIGVSVLRRLNASQLGNVQRLISYWNWKITEPLFTRAKRAGHVLARP
jgi:hypothetical protein